MNSAVRHRFWHTLNLIAIASLGLVVACCSDGGSVRVTGLADAVKLSVTQRALDSQMKSVESVLTLTFREPPADHTDWFADLVSTSFRRTSDSIRVESTPTDFDSDYSTSACLLDSRLLTPDVAREFSEAVPRHHPSERWEVRWKLRFAHRKTTDQVTVSTDWTPIR